jgi:hypothetical protein
MDAGGQATIGTMGKPRVLCTKPTEHGTYRRRWTSELNSCDVTGELVGVFVLYSGGNQE